MDNILIDKTDIEIAQEIDNKIFFKIKPIRFLKGDKRANPRLPRKSSGQTNLQKNTTEVFCIAFENIENYFCDKTKFKVEIIVHKSNDNIGVADLDNYCKAILDAVTQTKKIWYDDKQVDQIFLQRLHTSGFEYSYIDLTISKI